MLRCKAMDDPAPGASRLRPFETQPFNERSVLDALRKKSCDADARAALESQLAQGGVGSVTAVSAETLLRRFGVTGSAARSIVVSMWEQALKKLLFDDIKVDAAESAYLNELKTALGLRDEEVAGVRSAVLEPEFLRRNFSYARIRLRNRHGSRLRASRGTSESQLQTSESYFKYRRAKC